LQIRLGDQPIDALVGDPDAPLEPVHREALQQAVELLARTGRPGCRAIDFCTRWRLSIAKGCI